MENCMHLSSLILSVEIKDRKSPTSVTPMLSFHHGNKLLWLQFSSEKTINWMKGNESSFIN